ncbi:MAG: hypothetical protein ACSLFN_01865 [Candidatus Limnocylindrales bacterium]
MTQQPDIERLLDQWFSDGPEQAPDRVVDIVADRIERQSQRPAWRLHRRSIPVNSYAKVAVAVAAVLIVAVIGYNLLPSQSTGVGGPASPIPSSAPPASATPSAWSSANAVYPAWYAGESNGAGILPAGSQTAMSFVPRFTFMVPEGWVNSGDEAGFYGLFPDTPANQAEFAASEGLAQAIHMGPQTSPYFTCDAWEDNQGATAAEIVAAIVANDALAASEPVDVTIGGLTGKQIDVQLDSGWTDSCPGDPPGSDLGDMRTRGILLDTPDRGVIVIFVGSLHSSGHDAFLAEAMPIIESFQFETGE